MVGQPFPSIWISKWIRWFLALPNCADHCIREWHNEWFNSPRFSLYKVASGSLAWLGHFICAFLITFVWSSICEKDTSTKDFLKWITIAFDLITSLSPGWNDCITCGNEIWNSSLECQQHGRFSTNLVQTAYIGQKWQ
jgi:hypothetical protein